MRSNDAKLNKEKIQQGIGDQAKRARGFLIAHFKR